MVNWSTRWAVRHHGRVLVRTGSRHRARQKTVLILLDDAKIKSSKLCVVRQVGVTATRV